MKIVNVHEAKAHLSEILAAVERGEEIVIARRNKPIAKLVAVEPEAPKKRRPFGLAKGKVWMSPDFNEPMSEEELALWETPALTTNDPRHPEHVPVDEKESA